MADRDLAADDLIYDWNKGTAIDQKVELYDETLRDGLQATYVRQPDLAEKIEFPSRVDSLNMEWADVGFHAAGERQYEDVVALGKEKARGSFRVGLQCIARTTPADVAAALRAAEASGYAFEVGIFLGCSNIRKLVEHWDLASMERQVREVVSMAVRGGLSVMFVTEDTTRAHPETLEVLYKAAVEEGAAKICLADTVGYASPAGVSRLVGFVRERVLKDAGGVDIVWHGHRDRGLEVANCLAAIEAGATGLEGAALGVGERTGNTPMELILWNLAIENVGPDRDLSGLAGYAGAASRIMDYAMAPNLAVVGDEAFNTGSGVHAAAIRKALDMGRPDLAALVYSPFDPTRVNRQAGASVGIMSGRSNVLLKLKSLSLDPTEGDIDAVIKAAKNSTRSLTDLEIRRIVSRRAPRETAAHPRGKRTSRPRLPTPKVR